MIVNRNETGNRILLRKASGELPIFAMAKLELSPAGPVQAKVFQGAHRVRKTNVKDVRGQCGGLDCTEMIARFYSFLAGHRKRQRWDHLWFRLNLIMRAVLRS